MTAPRPGSLDGLLTEPERERLAVLARNAAIRERFSAMRAAGRTVAAALEALETDEDGPGYTLGYYHLRKVVYGRTAGGARPWLTTP